MRLRLAAAALAAVAMLPVAGSAAANDPLAKWFASQTCPALDGLYSKKEPPAVKDGADGLKVGVDIPQSVWLTLKHSMTVPWYLYDPKGNVALSHVGGDSGVVWTLRVVSGPPPVAVPHIDLSQARTLSGLKLGSSASSVIKTLGPPLIIHACGMDRYEYSDSSDKQSEQNDLDFTIKDGRVIEIVHTSWG